MARDDYWNTGRMEGLKSSTALENLERVLGLTQNVSQRVQARRQERGNALQRDMLLIVGEDGKNYKRLIDSGDISALKTQLQSLGDKVKKADVDTSGLYDFFINDIDKQIQDVERYNNDKKEIEELEQGFAMQVSNYVDNQAGYSIEHSQNMAKELEEKLKYYVNKKESFFNYFPDRTARDPNLLNAMTSVENYGNYIINDILYSDTNFIDKFEAEMFTTGLRDGNLEAYNQYHDKKDIAVATGAKTLQNSIQNNITAGTQEKVFYDALYSKPNGTFEQQVIAYDNTPSNIKKHYDSGDDPGSIYSKFSSQYSDYRNSGGSRTMEEYFNELREKRKLLYTGFLNQAEIDNESHISLTGNSFMQSIPGVSDVIDIEAVKGAPPAEIRQSINLHYDNGVSLFPLLDSIKTDTQSKGVKDLYDATLKAYEEEKSPSKKLSIKKQWNQWYDALDEDIKKHKHDRFRDASSVFITDINKIQ